MDVIILTFSMPRFPDHGLELVESQARKRSKSCGKQIWEMRDLQRNTEEERTLQNEQNPTYFSPSLTTGEALLHNFYLA